jgi:predicted outer membrane repeat protein
VITKSLTIEGNGITLTRAASWTASETSQLLRISGSTAEIQIQRVHFKDGLAGYYAGAVYNTGTLTLESCIFSGNRANNGGAIYSYRTLTIRGCTFYGNNTSSYGGAVFFASSGTPTLEGNLFYGNTAGTYYPVVYNSGGTASASYNVVDKAFGMGSAQAGWAQGAGDITTDALLVSPVSFKSLYNGQAANRLPNPLPPDYPLTDFYGNTISGGGAAGAVQTSTTPGNYLVELLHDSERGSVTIASPAPDADGLYPAGSLNITAAPESGYVLGYWLVDGVKAPAAPANLAAHTCLRAVFTKTLTVNTFTDTAGSAATEGTLRHALTTADEGDTITFTGVTAGSTTIELQSALPEITKNLTIEGSGITLTRAASWTASGTSQLLRIISGEVLIRGVHFKNGLATYGGAVYTNSGILTLESCIFSGNRATSSIYTWL